MNLKFAYLYRDGANYKNYNEVIFSNPNNRPVGEVDAIIKEGLIDRTWFVAKNGIYLTCIFWNILGT